MEERLMCEKIGEKLEALGVLECWSVEVLKLM